MLEGESVFAYLCDFIANEMMIASFEVQTLKWRMRWKSLR